MNYYSKVVYLPSTQKKIKQVIHTHKEKKLYVTLKSLKYTFFNNYNNSNISTLKS